MKHFNHWMAFTLITMICLSTLGCSDTNTEKSARARTELGEESQTRVALEDGVYPVVQAEEAVPKGEREIKVVELINVPVKGSADLPPERIRVIPRPLLRFRDVPNFDFTFEKNECTEVGFQNTHELKAYTRDHVGSRLAVVIDNKVISHHKVREAIEADQVRITCCTVGGGDHLHEHLKELKLASKPHRRSNGDD